MVCFVHNRQFLSKFHAAINQLRKTNEFTELTLHRLPKRCCSCPDKRWNMTSPTNEPSLTSINIDALRLICLQTELKNYIATNELSLPSNIIHYTVLSFPTLFESNDQISLTSQFIIQQHSQLVTLQRMHHVDLKFVTSNASDESLNEIIRIKHNLIAQCSTYSQAIQAINGLWVIISADDDSHVDIVKHALQQQWIRFLGNTNWQCTSMVYDWRQNLPGKIMNKSKRSSKIERYKINRAKRSEKKQQLLLDYKISEQMAEEQDKTEEEEEERMTQNCSTEEIIMLTHQHLQFLDNRFQNANKHRRPRTHRRQHTLALAMAT